MSDPLLVPLPASVWERVFVGSTVDLEGDTYTLLGVWPNGTASIASAAFRTVDLARTSAGFTGAIGIKSGGSIRPRSGAPLASVLFKPAVAGVVLLPILLYHLAQLVLAAPIANRLNRT